MPSTAPACELVHVNEARAPPLEPLLSPFSKYTAHPARGSLCARRTVPSTPCAEQVSVAINLGGCCSPCHRRRTQSHRPSRRGPCVRVIRGPNEPICTHPDLRSAVCARVARTNTCQIRVAADRQCLGCLRSQTNAGRCALFECSRHLQCTTSTTAGLHLREPRDYSEQHSRIIPHLNRPTPISSCGGSTQV
jgi:hypothetical protein